MAPQTQDQIDLSDGLVAKPGMDLSDGLVAKDSSAPAPAPEMGIRDSIEAAINDPGNVPDTGWRGEIEKFGQGAAQGLTQPFLHPLKTLGSMAETTPAGSLYDLVTGRPDASQKMGTDMAQGLIHDPSRTAGQLAGGFAGAHVLPAVASTAGGAVSRFRNFRPKPSPNIVSPAETAARNLTNAINPEPARAPSYIKAAQTEVPNVLDYARRTNNPLRTQAEFAKAAEGNAQEAANHYNNNVLGPNKDIHPTTAAHPTLLVEKTRRPRLLSETSISGSCRSTRS
jgi:hypothetical protein